MLRKNQKLPFDALTIVKPTTVDGEPVAPGESFEVPGEVTGGDAQLLIGIGKAIPGKPTGKNKAVVDKAISDYESALAVRADRKDKLKGVSNSELMASVMVLADKVTDLLAAGTGTPASKADK